MPIENMNSALIQILRQANVNAVYQEGNKIIAQVIKKLPLNQLKKEDIIPRTVNNIKTDVIEKGKIKYYHKYRPVIGGISCIESNKGAGTLGGIVKDKSSNKLVGLTCNHCAGTLFDINYTWPTYGNTALSHIKMYQPSKNDGGVLADSLGAPVRAVATRFGESGLNYVDAAIINIDNNLAKSDIRKINQGPFPFAITKQDYGIGQSVYKSGRNGFTKGIILSTNVAIMVTSGSDIVYYSGQIMIGGANFADNGDSGSLILVRANGIWTIIGLLFAGNESQTFACHITDVANLLNIEAWNGNIIADSAAPNILVNGKCYKYKGLTLEPLSHNFQREHSNCLSCRADKYPLDKIQMVQ